MQVPPRPPRAVTLLLLLAALAAAFGLRVVDLSAPPLTPDDGEFLRSARLHEVEPGLAPVRALREDAAWGRAMLADFGRDEGRATYPHGYLHQLAARWAWRLGDAVGLGRVAALRADQALLGALSALVVFLWLRRRAPGEPLVAVAGAGLMATQLAHAMTSRTGWGQVGCTAFLVVAVALAGELYLRVGEDDRRGLRRHALGIALATTVAYGFHEMATVYVAVLALLVVVLFPRAPDGTRRWPWRSRRVRAGLLACAPVLVLTLALLAFSEFARTKWFAADLAGLGWWETRRLAWTYFGEVELLAQLGLPLLLLAALGVGGALARDARWATWLVAWAALPAALLFLRFNFPHLVRIYLPSVVVLVVLAAEGLGVLWCLARTRHGQGAVDALALGVVALAGWTCVDTLHRGPDATLHVAGAHVAPLPDADPRHVERPLVEALWAARPEEPVAVAFRWGALFRLLDAGIDARFVELDAEPEPPLHIVGPWRHLAGRTVDRGGRYVRVATDAYGRDVLLRRID